MPAHCLKFLKIALLLVVFCTCACSSSSRSNQSISELSKAAELQGYTIVKNNLSQEILSNIHNKLSFSAKRAGYDQATLPVSLIVQASKCLALNLGDTLLISDSLIVRLDHLTELAFIIAHESAHTLLKHEVDKDNLAAQHNAELEADYLALGLIAYAGYNPWYAVDALIKAYSCNYWATTSSHPPLQTRIEAMTKQLTSLGFWHSDYTSENRDFEKLKHFLKSK